MAKGKKVFVLMFDDDGSKEKGVPIAVFRNRQAHSTLMDYVPSDSPEDIKQMFSDGFIWYATAHLG